MDREKTPTPTPSCTDEDELWTPNDYPFSDKDNECDGDDAEIEFSESEDDKAEPIKKKKQRRVSRHINKASPPTKLDGPASTGFIEELYHRKKRRNAVLPTPNTNIDSEIPEDVDSKKDILEGINMYYIIYAMYIYQCIFL